MKCLLVLVLAVSMTGCSQQNSETSPETSEKQPSAGKQATERMTGQTAVKAYKRTQDVLVDVKKSTGARSQSVKDFNKE